MINVRVQLVYGSYHDVDSSQIAFEQAGALAVREACTRAGLSLLEPERVCPSPRQHLRSAGD